VSGAFASIAEVIEELRRRAGVHETLTAKERWGGGIPTWGDDMGAAIESEFDFDKDDLPGADELNAWVAKLSPACLVNLSAWDLSALADTVKMIVNDRLDHLHDYVKDVLLETTFGVPNKALTLKEEKTLAVLSRLERCRL